MDKIKILVAPSDIWACDLYRSSGPHKKLQEMFPNDFDITYNYYVDWIKLTKNNQYDIIYLHVGYYPNLGQLFLCEKELKKKSIIIVDIDDYWILPDGHEAKNGFIKGNYEQINIKLIKLADFIVTTNSYFSSILKTYNNSVNIFPNTIDFSKYNDKKVKSNRLRFGLCGSKSHYHDYQQLIDVPNLASNYIDKLQFVLCGYAPMWDNVKINNTLTRIPIFDGENPWFKYENLITNNYRIISKEYKNYLLKFKDEVIVDEPYIRLYEKDINTYLTHYYNIDVLLAPLKECEFNNCKSELKFLEAALTNTALIASNTGPYKIGTSILNPDGTINLNGNCILVEENSKSWWDAIKLFIDRPDLLDLSKNNLKYFIFNNYNITDYTKKRYNWYKNLVKCN